MKFSINVRAPRGEPLWRVTFKKRTKLRPIELRAKTEGLAVRELLRRHVDVKLIETLAMVGALLMALH